MQLADVGDGLGLPGFQLDVLHISGAVPLVQAGKGSFSAVTAVSEQGDKVFLIEIGRRGIGVRYIQMDLHLPEIISVILGKGTDVIHPQAAYRGHGSAALRRVACAAKQAGSGSSQRKGAGALQESASVKSLHKNSSCAQMRFFQHSISAGNSQPFFSCSACTLPCST